jgi:exodeoxyribonuclease VIII
MTSSTLVLDGIHKSLDEKVYRADPAIAISDLKEMLLSPAHFYSKKFGGYRPKQSEAQSLGTLVHFAALEPERFMKEVVTLPADAPRKPTEAQRNAKKPSDDTVAAIAWWDNWAKETAAKQVVDEEDLAKAKEIATSIMAHSDASSLLTSAISTGGTEVAMFRTLSMGDKEFPVTVRIKGKADIITPTEVIADIKTVDRGQANPNAFSRAIDKWAYHLQAAWYLDLYNAVSGANEDFSAVVKKTRWVFIVVEKEPPYSVCTLELDDVAKETGRRINQVLMDKLVQCMAKGSWPTLSFERSPIGLPQWSSSASAIN